MSYLSDLLGTAYKEGMTEEEISAALETASKAAQTVGTSQESPELTRIKQALSKANSEAADYKRQLREKQSADEAAAADQKEQLDKLIADNAALQRTINLTDKKAKLMAAGYDEQTAMATATALLDGDFDTVLANQANFLASQRQHIEAELMKKTGRPSGGSVESAPDYTKQIADAQASGNGVAAAYYSRLQAQVQAEAGDHS